MDDGQSESRLVDFLGSLAGVELTDCSAAFGSFGAAVVRAAPPSPVCAAAGGVEAGGEGDGEVEVAPQWTFRLLHCPAKLQPVDQRLEVTLPRHVPDIS